MMDAATGIPTPGAGPHSPPVSRRRLLRRAALVAVPALAASGYFAYRRKLRQDGIAATLRWGRLAPFPASATDLRVETSGSMFTREFEASFTAPAADVAAWLAASPGTGTVTPVPDGSSLVYPITPGGGAQFAQVRLGYIDSSVATVHVRVYWS
jgi:hypothetical protein